VLRFGLFSEMTKVCSPSETRKLSHGDLSRLSAGKIFIFTELQPCDLPDFVTLAKAAHAHPVTICHHPNAGIQILMKAEALNSEGCPANARPV
jgi:hypothetical protein